MMLRTTALTIFLASAKVVLADDYDEVPTLCYEYSDLQFDLDDNSCRANRIANDIGVLYRAKKDASDIRCRGGYQNDVMALTGTTTYDAALQVITDMCTDALADAAVNGPTLDELEWGIDVDFDEYYEGEGPLNEETGNFQQETDRFYELGGYDKYISISTDPRLNDHYTTTDESYQAGVQVNYTYYEHSMKRYLKAPTDIFADGCPTSNTVMCCYSRDRQSFDGNGGCSSLDCARENPGDNTDLCWTETGDGSVFPYPGDSTEKNLHCHGFSWGNDVSAGYDINALAKWNNLFYVSMYDHMYKRGYVESFTSDPLIDGDIPMCGCIEDMAPVARADCTEMLGYTNYTVTVDASDMLVINYVLGTFVMEFDSCDGYKYDSDANPDNYEQERNGLRDQDNDLSGFVYRLWLEGKLDDDKVALVKETLIGYEKTDLSDNDNRREEACEEAFGLKFPDLTYEEGEQFPTIVGSIFT